MGNKEVTPREKEVLSLISQGYNNKYIARRLSVSPRTVEKHIKNLHEKLPEVSPNKNSRVVLALYGSKKVVR